MDARAPDPPPWPGAGGIVGTGVDPRLLLSAQLAAASALAEAGALAEAAPRILRALVEQLGWDAAALWIEGAAAPPGGAPAGPGADPDGAPPLRCADVQRAPGATHAALDALGDRTAGGAAAAHVREARRRGAAVQIGAVPGTGLAAACAVPIASGGRAPLGAIELLAVDPRRDDPELLRVLSTIGAQIAQFIDRRSAELELVRKTAELEAVFTSLPDLCFRVGGDGRLIAYYTPQPRHLYARPEDFMGRRFADVLPPAIGAALEEAIAQAHRTSSVSTCEYALPMPGGERWYEGRFVPSDHGHTICLIQDITERRRAEEALRRREERSHESQKMEAIGRLAGGIAHDFNNLLMAILGYGELLLRRLDATDPRRRDALEIKRAGERAASLTRQLLAFSRRQVLQPTLLDLGAVVLDMQEMLRRLIGETIDLQVLAAPGLPAVKADRSQLEQVLLNLVLNARDAMAKGGRLVIETSLRSASRPPAPEGDAPLEERAPGEAPAPPSPHVVLSVSDTGCGMDAETRSHLFEPFFTTKEQGTGLGLATAYGIVRQSGGHVAVESEVGRGTTFRVYLPVAADPIERADRTTPTSSRPPVTGRESILIAEDDAAVRGLIIEVLERRGFAVVAAASGEAALAILAGGATFDLLLTDVVMPGMNGRELAARAAELLPSLRVLYMSGYTDDAVTAEDLDHDAGLLQKPFTPEALARRLRAALDRR